MTKRMYRLADERDIGKEVFYSDYYSSIFNAYPQKLKSVSNEIESREPFSVNTGFWRYAVIEITPADFSTDDLRDQLCKRGLSATPYPIEPYCEESNKPNELAKKKLADSDCGYRWVEAEWPRDEGKGCRFREFSDENWRYGIIRAHQEFQGSFVFHIAVPGKPKDKKMYTTNSCQVRSFSISKEDPEKIKIEPDGDNSQWIQAELPRDQDKPCRVIVTNRSFPITGNIISCDSKYFSIEKENIFIVAPIGYVEVRADSIVNELHNKLNPLTINICCPNCKKKINCVFSVKKILGIEYHFCTEKCAKEYYESTLYREPVNGQDRFKECEYQEFDGMNWHKGIFIRKDFGLTPEGNKFYVLSKVFNDTLHAKQCRIKRESETSE